MLQLLFGIKEQSNQIDGGDFSENAENITC